MSRKLKLPKITTFDVEKLVVKAHFRYVGVGIDDEIHPSMPGLVGNSWEVEIDVDTGAIADWPYPYDYKVFGKVADDGEYHLKDCEGRIVASLPLGSYVQNSINNGNSDYIDINIKSGGIIEDWKFDYTDFFDYAVELIEEAIR
jgi:hypothetical protein